MSTARLDVSRYKRLAVRSADTWQGGLFRLPMWIQENDDDRPYRPTGAFWRSVRTGLIWILCEPEARTANAELALHALLEFGQKHERELMGRPARIEVPNARLAEELRQLLDDRDTTVAVVEHLPEVSEALCELGERNLGALPPGLMETQGVSFEHVRRFAEAACDFYNSEPWEALEPEDLVAVNIPGLDPEMRFLVVTGTTRETRGVMFYVTRDHFERFRLKPPTGGKKPRMWIIAFDPIDCLPFADVDAWEDFCCPSPQPTRIRGPAWSRRWTTWSGPMPANLRISKPSCAPWRVPPTMSSTRANGRAGWIPPKVLSRSDCHCRGCSSGMPERTRAARRSMMARRSHNCDSRWSGPCAERAERRAWRTRLKTSRASSTRR
jgi:hypothetical protein